jgi:hypothetical protein
MATLRADDTWNVPSTFGANGVQSELGLGAATPLRKLPIPKSLKAKPSGLGVNPKKSGVF